MKFQGYFSFEYEYEICNRWQFFIIKKTSKIFSSGLLGSTQVRFLSNFSPCPFKEYKHIRMEEWMECGIFCCIKKKKQCGIFCYIIKITLFYYRIIRVSRLFINGWQWRWPRRNRQHLKQAFFNYLFNYFIINYYLIILIIYILFIYLCILFTKIFVYKTPQLPCKQGVWAVLLLLCWEKLTKFTQV